MLPAVAWWKVVPPITFVAPVQLSPPRASVLEQALGAHCLSQPLNMIVFKPTLGPHAVVEPPFVMRNEQLGTVDQAFIAAFTSVIIVALGGESGLTRNTTGCPLSGSNHRGFAELIKVY